MFAGGRQIFNVMNFLSVDVWATSERGLSNLTEFNA